MFNRRPVTPFGQQMGRPMGGNQFMQQRGGPFQDYRQQMQDWRQARPQFDMSPFQDWWSQRPTTYGNGEMRVWMDQRPDFGPYQQQMQDWRAQRPQFPGMSGNQMPQFPGGQRPMRSRGLLGG